MDTSRFWGGVLCAVITLVAVVFLWGVSARSYWAVAIPVMIGFLGVLAMGFWIGWTILTIKTAPPPAEPSPSSPPEGEKSGSSIPPVSENTPH